MKKTDIKKNVKWVLGLCILVVLTVACVVFTQPVAQKEYVLLPPHQIAVKQKIFEYLVDRFEETLSFYDPGWPGKDKDKVIDAWKKINTLSQPLELELGPLEIRENETFDQATRVVVPVLSEKEKNLSTGEVYVRPGNSLVDVLLEKQPTPDGQQWRIISYFNPNYAEVESTWLKLPRKKVPGSPGIILKKAFTFQIISDNNDFKEESILWDEDVSLEDVNELSGPHKAAAKSLLYNLLNRIEESFSFSADWDGEDKRNVIESMKENDIKSNVESLEWKLSPVEIRDNETFDQATRAVVPILTLKESNISSGEIIENENAKLVLEKRETSEGQQWLIISNDDPKYSEIKSSWLNLPRKKVTNSPTIILKKGVLVQIVYKDKIVSEKTITWDNVANSNLGI